MEAVDTADQIAIFKRWIPNIAFSFFFVVCLSGEKTKTYGQYAAWEHRGVINILTTPAGALLSEKAVVRDFPVLVRLHKDYFPFSEAAGDGRDVRFSSAGKPLPFEIDYWDPSSGTAAVWVRIPEIRGNQRQEFLVHWGNNDSKAASDGQSVFDASNGYVGVWHLGEKVEDTLGNLPTEDRGTRLSKGMIGQARFFADGKGIFCGDEINKLPAGHSPHSTQTWFRPEKANARLVSWGNEKSQGKVQMWYRSPQRIRMDCYFSNGDVQAEIPTTDAGWVHAFHTFKNDQSTLYINGEKQGTGSPRHTRLSIERPARMFIGGWYHRYDYQGDIDEVRISSVARSADWIKLEYENQRRLQTLVGPVVSKGTSLKVSPAQIESDENEEFELRAEAGGAIKTYWSIHELGKKTVIATDRFVLPVNAGRVRKDRHFEIHFSAVYPSGIKTIRVPVTIRDTIPEPEFTLESVAAWDGRETIVIQPQLSNLSELKKAGVDKLKYKWQVTGIASVYDIENDRLVLKRSQNSGTLKIKLALSNGGQSIEKSTSLAVTEPTTDPWIFREPDVMEMPQEGQFYARDARGYGKMYCRGVLDHAADETFLRLFADGKKIREVSMRPKQDKRYRLETKLNGGLVNYSMEFGIRAEGVETVLYKAGNIVCGDAYLINGQSNALATDTREQSPRVTNRWIRSYGRPRFFEQGKRENLWCQPVWKAGKNDLAELGWWGMELANRLVESHKVPIFILNAARGGTRIDQHQRNPDRPNDLETIYGRMLWRIQSAKLTHGIRAMIWHQGENDQGAAGPDGGYGWESYQRYFVQMSAGWKRDFPNVSRYYVFQIWPNACSMGRDGNGDMLREKQRTLVNLFSKMDLISTLDIRPPGGCHFPLEGWSVFAQRVKKLIDRDFYQQTSDRPLTAANLKKAHLGDNMKTVVLEFDQPVQWNDNLLNEFSLDGNQGLVDGGSVNGNVLTLKLKVARAFERITYLRESVWSQDRLLMGENGMAALTFSKVPLAQPAGTESKNISRSP